METNGKITLWKTASCPWVNARFHYSNLWNSGWQLLWYINIIDMQDFGVMMKISIFIGVAHLILANAMSAWLWRWSMVMLSHIGWIFLFAGASLIWTGASV